MDIFDRVEDVVMVVTPWIRERLVRERVFIYSLLSLVFLISLIAGFLLVPLGIRINLLRETVVVYLAGMIIAIIIHIFQVRWVLPLMLARTVLLGSLLSFWFLEFLY